MTDTPYNMPPLGLFGKRCRILTGYDERPFVYRIVNSELMSNTWCEPPITYQSGRSPVRHDHSENVLIVVLDTLIDENSRLIRVALKDVELMDEVPDNAGWISVKDRLPENEQMVIGYTPIDGYMFIGFHRTEFVLGYDVSSWYIVTAMRSTKKITKKVTHWMPLPEGPKEE